MCGMVAHARFSGRAGAMVGLVSAVAYGAVLALRPRDGLIAPEPVAAGAALADWLRRRLPRAWWLAGAGAVVGATGAMVLAGPVVLDPLFNTFTPLEDGPLRRDVLDLAQRAGVRVREVYVVDASRRT